MKLSKNHWYIFHINNFETATGEVISKEPIVRKYLGYRLIGAVGLSKEKFYLVQKECGKEHLLHPETVLSFEEIV